MAEVIDYLTSDSTGDLVISGGDFAKGDCTLKHQKDLMLAEKGDYKQFPTTGVGLKTHLLNDASEDELRAEIQAEFEADGMRISKIQISSVDSIDIEASYGG